MGANIYIRETLEDKAAREDGSFDFKTTTRAKCPVRPDVRIHSCIYEGEASGIEAGTSGVASSKRCITGGICYAGNYRLQEVPNGKRCRR